MNPLALVLMICPPMAQSPAQCMIGLESPVVEYASKQDCEAEARKRYEKMRVEAEAAGMNLRFSCVPTDAINKLKQLKRNNGIAA